MMNTKVMYNFYRAEFTESNSDNLLQYFADFSFLWFKKMYTFIKSPNHQITKLFLGFLLISSSSFSQDFSADMLKMQNINRAEKFSMKYSTESKITDGTKDSIIHSEGTSVRYNEKFYADNSLMENISNGDTLIVVDHVGKNISIYNAKAMSAMLNFKSADFSDINKNDSVVFLGLQGDVKTYAVYFKKGNVNKVHLQLDTNGFIKEMATYYHAPAEDELGTLYIITRYSNITNHLSKDDFTYSISSCLVGKKGKLWGVGKCKGYSIDNHFRK